MNLDISKWGKFRIGKLFYKLENGKANDGMLDDGDERIYLGAKKDDNGVMRHCASNLELEQDGNCIIFICNGQGSVGYANYMNDTFIGTSDIVAGYCDNMNEFIGEFMATVFCLERPKYSFGRKWKTHLRDTIVKLPMKHNADGTPFVDRNKKYSDDGYVPDWQFMEDYMKSLNHKPLTTKNKSENVPQLDVEKWKEFYIGKLFNINRGKTLSSENKEEFIGDDYSCINGGSVNNGELCKMSEELQEIGFILQEVPSLSLSRVGNAGLTFLQTEPYYIADNAFSLVLKKQKNKFVYLFLSTCLNSEVFKYSYGRTISSEKYMLTAIKLPVQHSADGTIFIDDKHTYSEEGYVPDWQFMEDYIKLLPYGDRL